MSRTTPAEGATPTARRSPETTGVARFPDWVWVLGEESTDPLVHVDGPGNAGRRPRPAAQALRRLATAGAPSAPGAPAGAGG